MSLEAQFELRISENITEKQWVVDVFLGDGDWYGQTVGEDFDNTFRHAMYLADPVLAAAVFPDTYDWVERHNTPLS